MDNIATLIFATNNTNKVAEIKHIINPKFIIKSLAEANINDDIPEPYPTIKENAQHKACFIYDKYHLNCFSEDTGLIVPALNGAPGVHSARYAGPNATSADNLKKIIADLNGLAPCAAYFNTIIAYKTVEDIQFFEGVCQGTITLTPKGDAGFGYDPIFIPNGSSSTFAEMTMEQKGQYSHRKKAFAQLIAYLQTTI
jgi:XTP/dITP diphosphohydrolase